MARIRATTLSSARPWRTSAAELLDPATASEYALKDVLWPMAVADKLLALASERAVVDGLTGRTDVRAVIAQPRVFVTTIGPDPTTPSGFAFSTDLALDGVRVLELEFRGPGSAVRSQLWYGVLETALKSSSRCCLARTFDPAATGTSPAPASPPPRWPVSRCRRDERAGLGAGRAARGGPVRPDRALPRDPATAGVWWTVAPDGTTRSILDPGWAAWQRLAIRRPRRQAAGSKGGSGGYGNKFKYNRPTEPPSRCQGGQEYTLLLGCVSLPAAWALRVSLRGSR